MIGLTQLFPYFLNIQKTNDSSREIIILVVTGKKKVKFLHLM